MRPWSKRVDALLYNEETAESDKAKGREQQRKGQRATKQRAESNKASGGTIGVTSEIAGGASDGQ
ncbi:hypothetical protein Bca4012_026993 [Brassica carinata]